MMSSSNELLPAIEAQRLVPVLRTKTVEDAIETARVCVSEGLKVIEFTTSTPGYMEAVEVLAKEGAFIGVGTLRDTENLAKIRQAGAMFSVSYFAPNNFVKESIQNDLMPIPGVLTPTEMQLAVNDGAKVLKIFPAWQSSPRVIGDVAPLIGPIKFMPTGGLNPESIKEWIKAGAIAVGAGSQLGTLQTVGEEKLRMNIRAALKSTV
jgi:2-dehydro-3-deoxyphosphogluconate aldolase/(4S)-4-hydroxy-2-oxoglutarate aldolase